MKPISPTPYADINEILDLILTDAREILQAQFVGMYLFGSLANGGFDEHSDIDVLIVTDGNISDDQFAALKRLHAKVNTIDSPWSIQVEASYIPQDALRRYDPAKKVHPHMDRGIGEVLHMMSHETDWVIQRHLLREHGIPITGPDLQTLIDPVSPDDMRRAVAEVLPLWVIPMLANSSIIKMRGYQSFVVLSLCRMLYTFRSGKVLSKPAAAAWAMENLNSRWKPLIERAWLGRQNSDLDAEQKDVDETLEMIKYSLAQITPTLYTDVNELLNLLLSNVKEIVRDQFVGMYLYGSLASGDFNPETSDIDFLVVTTDYLSDETIAKLEDMHKQTWATSLNRAGELEGSYVPRELIRRHDPNGAPCPTVNEGKFYLDQRGSDWIIQRHVIREQGVVVEGPDPKTLIDFVSPDDIRRAVIGTLHEWWFPMLDDSSWLRDHESVYRAFAVITMCRVLHALEHGSVVSKPNAVQWARAHLDDPWRRLIDKAVLVSNHESLDLDLPETLDFIRFIHEKVKS